MSARVGKLEIIIFDFKICSTSLHESLQLWAWAYVLISECQNCDLQESEALKTWNGIDASDVLMRRFASNTSSIGHIR